MLKQKVWKHSAAAFQLCIFILVQQLLFLPAEGQLWTYKPQLTNVNLTSAFQMVYNERSQVFALVESSGNARFMFPWSVTKTTPTASPLPAPIVWTKTVFLGASGKPHGIASVWNDQGTERGWLVTLFAERKLVFISSLTFEVLTLQGIVDPVRLAAFNRNTNFYVPLWGPSCVQQLYPPGGAVQPPWTTANIYRAKTVAGICNSGGNRDGHATTTALLQYPYGIAATEDGHSVFITSGIPEGKTFVDGFAFRPPCRLSDALNPSGGYVHTIMTETSPMHGVLVQPSSTSNSITLYWVLTKKAQLLETKGLVEDNNAATGYKILSSLQTIAAMYQFEDVLMLPNGVLLGAHTQKTDQLASYCCGSAYDSSPRYVLLPTPVPFSQAVEACAQRGLRFTFPQAEEDFLQLKSVAGNTVVWLNAKFIFYGVAFSDDGLTETVIYPLTDALTGAPTPNLGYTNLAVDQPNEIFPFSNLPVAQVNEVCLGMNWDSPTPGKWDDRVCNDIRSIVCRNVSSNVVSIVPGTFDWNQARAGCEAKGLKFTAPRNAAENAFLAQWSTTISWINAKLRVRAIDMTANNPEIVRKEIWPVGPLAKYFLTGQPNNFVRSPPKLTTCVHYYWPPSSFFMGDEPCTNSYRPLCEDPSWRTLTPSVPPTRTATPTIHVQTLTRPRTVTVKNNATATPSFAPSTTVSLPSTTVSTIKTHSVLLMSRTGTLPVAPLGITTETPITGQVPVASTSPPLPPTSSAPPNTTLPPPPPSARQLLQDASGVPAAAVTTTAVTAAAAGAAVSPTAASKASNLKNVLSSLQCHFEAEQDTEVGAAEVLVVWRLGSSEYSSMLGPIITCSCFVLSSLAIAIGLFPLACPGAKAARIAFSMVLSVAMGYFVPTVAGMSTLVLAHSSRAYDRAIAVLGFAAVLVSYAVPLFVVKANVLGKLRPIKQPGHAATNNSNKAAATASSLEDHLLKVLDEAAIQREQQRSNSGVRGVKWSLPGTDSKAFGLRCFYDVSRDMNHAGCVFAYFEDLTVAVAMSVVSSLKLPNANCTLISGILALIALLHVIFLLAVRPYRTKIDEILSVVIGLLQLLVALLVTGSTVSPPLLPWLGYAAMILAASFLGQTVVLIGWSVYKWNRRAQQRANTSVLQKQKAGAGGKGKGDEKDTLPKTREENEEELSYLIAMNEYEEHEMKKLQDPKNNSSKKKNEVDEHEEEEDETKKKNVADEEEVAGNLTSPQYNPLQLREGDKYRPQQQDPFYAVAARFQRAQLLKEGDEPDDFFTKKLQILKKLKPALQQQEGQLASSPLLRVPIAIKKERKQGSRRRPEVQGGDPSNPLSWASLRLKSQQQQQKQPLPPPRDDQQQAYDFDDGGGAADEYYGHNNNNNEDYDYDHGDDYEPPQREEEEFWDGNSAAFTPSPERAAPQVSSAPTFTTNPYKQKTNGKGKEKEKPCLPGLCEGYSTLRDALHHRQQLWRMQEAAKAYEGTCFEGHTVPNPRVHCSHQGGSSVVVGGSSSTSAGGVSSVPQYARYVAPVSSSSFSTS